MPGVSNNGPVIDSTVRNPQQPIGEQRSAQEIRNANIDKWVADAKVETSSSFNAPSFEEAPAQPLMHDRNGGVLKKLWKQLTYRPSDLRHETKLQASELKESLNLAMKSGSKTMVGQVLQQMANTLDLGTKAGQRRPDGLTGAQAALAEFFNVDTSGVAMGNKAAAFTKDTLPDAQMNFLKDFVAELDVRGEPNLAVLKAEIGRAPLWTAAHTDFIQDHAVAFVANGTTEKRGEFLRDGKNAFQSKLNEVSDGDYKKQLAATAFEAAKTAIATEVSDLKRAGVDPKNISVQSQGEVGAAIKSAAYKVADILLNPQQEAYLGDSIPEEFQEFLAESSRAILDTNMSFDDKKFALRTLYNSCVTLRNISPAMTHAFYSRDNGLEKGGFESKLLREALNFVQSASSGSSGFVKFSPEQRANYLDFKADFTASVDACYQELGMPTDHQIRNPDTYMPADTDVVNIAASGNANAGQIIEEEDSVSSVSSSDDRAEVIIPMDEEPDQINIDLNVNDDPEVVNIVANSGQPQQPQAPDIESEADLAAFMARSRLNDQV